MKVSNEKCPWCKGELTIENKNQLYCKKCIIYYVNGQWMHIWCDEYHRHTSECLVPYTKPLPKEETNEQYNRKVVLSEKQREILRYVYRKLWNEVRYDPTNEATQKFSAPLLAKMEEFQEEVEFLDITDA